MKVAIDCTTGMLFDRGADESWTVHEGHPDSKTPFKSFRIPGIHRAADICQRLHLRIPHLALVGWDFAIDPQGAPWLLEWGAITPGFSFIEAEAGPLFPDLDVSRLGLGEV